MYRTKCTKWEWVNVCVCLRLSNFPPSLQRVKHKSQPLSLESNGRPMAVYGKRDKTIHFSIQQQYYNIAYKKHQRALTHPLWKMRCTYFRKRIATSAITRAHSACSNVSICSTRAVMFFPLLQHRCNAFHALGWTDSVQCCCSYTILVRQLWRIK